MKYAVISQNGKQYKVKEDEEVLFDHQTAQEQLEIDNILLVVDGEKVKIGTPTVKEAKVIARVLETELKGDKIKVVKYKAKSRYRKTIGFRPMYTRAKIESITF